MEQHIGPVVNLLLSQFRVCVVRPFFETLSEEYPAPVCNECGVPMMVRTEVIRAEEGTHKEVRCGFQCPQCRAVVPVRSEKRRLRLGRQDTFPFAG